MAFSKARRLGDLITANAEQFITSAHITDTAITGSDIHSTFDLTGKTVTVATASAGDNDTSVASTAFVQQEIASLVDSAPGTLNTLNELAAALGDDASFSTTVTNSIATKLPLSGGTLTGTLTATQFLVSGNTSVQGIQIGQDASNSTNSGRLFFTESGGSWAIFNSNDSLSFNNGGTYGSSSGTQRAYLTAAGNLNIDGTFTSGGDLTLGSDSVASKINILGDVFTLDVDSNGNTGGAPNMRFAISGSEKARIDSSGRLSVGISSSAGGVATFFGTGTGAEAKVQIEGEGGADPFINFLVNNTTHWAVGARDSDSDKFMIANNSDLSSGVALTIDSAENVGIGTTSPVSLGGHDGVLTLFGSNATALVLKNDTSSSRLAQLGSDLGFFVATYETERMRLTSTGLGIGTTSPTQRLHVDGGNALIKSAYDSSGTTNAYMYFASRTSGNWRNSTIGNSGTDLVFSTGGTGTTHTNATERMRIKSAGIILGGTTTAPNYPGTITAARTGSSSTTNQATWSFLGTAGGSNKDFAYKATGSGSYAYGVLNAAETTWMSRLDFSGAIHLTNTTVQSISDRRLKKDIVDANSQWDDIKALQFKNFKWIDDSRGDGTYLGLIADEVESVSPGLVGIDSISAETMPDDGVDPEYKNVKYSILWMKATKALQEAMERIETLEARIETLEG